MIKKINLIALNNKRLLLLIGVVRGENLVHDSASFIQYRSCKSIGIYSYNFIHLLIINVRTIFLQKNIISIHILNFQLYITK